MIGKKGIFWLASYPKSGNTWFRIFLANVLNPSKTPIDLNKIHTGAIASARGWVDEALGFDSAHLTHDELDALRPAVYRWQSDHQDDIGYHKIHDAYTYLENSDPLIPTEGNLGALYFIRNPLDVAISFANHSRCTIDKAIEQMGKPHNAFCKGVYRQHSQLRQKLLTWSMHVQSWAEAADLNVLVLRYEDMKQNPIPTFTKAAEFLQLKASQQTIEIALENAHIEKLQQQEEQSGFCEKPANVSRFFRKGIVGDWQNTLTPVQIQQIISDHADVMQYYGYIDANQNPIIM